jgi:hypothetical protein
MKTISKIIQFAGSIGLAIGLVAVTAVPTFAVNDANNGASSASCTRIATLSSSTNTTIAGHAATMYADFANRLSGIANRDTVIDQKVAAARTISAGNFSTKISNLEAKTGFTVTQETAIKTFATNMQMAETTRETAIDAARASYRINLISLVKTHQAALRTATTTYQAAVSAAFVTASTQCGDGSASATLKATVKAGRDTFKTARADAKITTEIKALITTRNTAIESANADFKKAATTYKATLSAVLRPTDSKTNS